MLNGHIILKQLLEDVSENTKIFIETLKSICFYDCFSYVSLHLAIRSGNWDLRIAAIKSMAELFTTYDRPNYHKLIAQHIHDLHTMPEEALKFLCSGGFTVSLTGRPCHSIGIDEAHEMCINKDCKEFITRPSGDYINRVAKFLPVRAKAMKNLEAQNFPERNLRVKNQSIKTLYTSDAATKKLDMNIRKQAEKLSLSSTLSVDNEDN